MKLSIWLNWITIVETGQTEGIGRASCRFDQAFQAEVVQGVEIQVLSYLINGVVGSNELILRGEINPVITGMASWRATYQHVYLFYS